MASFYKNLDLMVYNTFVTKKLLKLPIVERNNYFRYGLFTKKLTIGNDKEEFIHYSRGLDENLVKEDDCRFDKEDWVQLLEYLPNLQELDLSCSCNGEIYLQHIYETDSKKALLKIQEIKPIDQNPFSFRRELLSLLFAVCYKYRESITTLKVAFFDPVFSFGFISGHVTTLLNDFKRLTCLTFTNECDESLTTLDLQASCPLLVSLAYYSDYNVPDDTIKDILDNEASNAKNVKCSLKKMVISGASIPKYYSRYIIDYVSPYLDVFNLNMYEHDMYDWVDYIGYENALNLLRNMNTIEEAGVRWHPDKYYERTSTDTGSDATIFFTLLNAFKGDKQLYCKADYGDFRSPHKGMVHTKDELRVEYGLSYHDYLQINENVQNDSDEDGDEETDVRPSNRTVHIKLPDTSISSIGPEIIHHLSVTMCNSNPDLPVNFLRYAFLNCPNLQYFFYYSMNDPYYHICIGNSIDIGSHSQEKKNSLTNTAQENITVAKFQNMLPSEEIMELLNTYSPRIETIVCGCKNRYTDPPKSDGNRLDSVEPLKSVISSS
ncbi:hypothetical protein INT47_000887 [Mucor saturninus]|uniref:Uncharacterized protein n=1 Tax=Mucor saturninus TaxID=64648 RepID=A0A8H7RNH0_9FUNG|nr:hypothetical protein INT47_000887 [Mucor saturninus]